MRLIRMSLATKYRVLFGFAVLLIIGAALSLPWYLVKALVEEQPFREAQRIADEYFRVVMAAPDAAAATIGGVHGAESAVLPKTGIEHFAEFIPLSLNLDAQSAPGDDPFVAAAIARLRDHPKDEFYRVTKKDEYGTRFDYAHAVRVRKQCLDCHDEGKTAGAYREGQLAGIIAVRLPAEGSEEAILVLRVLLVAAGLLAGILALLVFYIITKKFILSPIHELGAVTIRVAEGDLDVRSTTRTGDEFEQLSDNLNRMLERLRESQDKLKKANRLLDQKLGEMAETNVALYESNKLKAEFLANVSHELRTPLTSIIVFAELLREGPSSEGNGRAARYAENILISGRILLEMINDLLDLAKIEAGKIELRIETVRLDELCESMLDLIRPLAAEKRIELRLEIDAALPALFTDRGRLRQILHNLISNAVKFTPADGSVRVGARREGEGHVRVWVADSGPGIADEQQAVIFEKFRQIDQSATREHHGSGLGLAIAKDLTRVLGGEIGVDSRPGHGATFWVRLPTTAPEQRELPMISLV